MSDVPSQTAASLQNTADAWATRDAEALYAIDRWSEGHFSVSERGTVLVHPTGEPEPAIDLHAATGMLRARGVAPPVVLRFPDLLRHRVARLRGAFAGAIEARGYPGGHCCLYPIKANQHRAVCDAVLSCADPDDPQAIGLEVGSKPELLAALALTGEAPATPIVCNGFKDEAFLDAILLATRLGRPITPIVERMDELERLLARAASLGVRPALGVRLKPTSPGAGRWHESAGSRSKFGLRLDQIIEAVERLRAARMLDRLSTVHVHVGSQVCDLRPLTRAVVEAARVYAELHRLGASPHAIDIGGGLGIDYQGTRSPDHSSMNYTIDDYAGGVVGAIADVCERAGVPHPRVLTEAGRAMVASSSVLVFDALGASRLAEPPNIDGLRARAATELDDASPIRALVELIDEIGSGAPAPLADILDRADAARADAAHRFSEGTLPIDRRSDVERLYWHALRHALARAEHDAAAPGDADSPAIAQLRLSLGRIYDANLSVFQSVPDAWAIGHVFPVAPIHRLDERPTELAVLGDVTCDSDGALTRFPIGRGTRTTLPVHEPRPGERYTMACFLVGAYQEVLGDVHNLFGNPAIASVSLDADARPTIDAIIPGERARDVLAGVGFSVEAMRDALRTEADRHADRTEARAWTTHCERMLDESTYPR